MTVRVFSLAALIPLLYSAITDWKRRIIPNTAVVAIVVCAVARAVITGASLSSVIVGGIVIGVFLIMAASFGKCELNGGDIKLNVAIGMFYGPGTALSLFVVSLLLLLIYAKAKKVDAAPFAPFMFFSVAVFELYLLFNQGV